MKGSYVLLVELTDDEIIAVGRMRNICFRGGFYAYVGSAMNGIESRLSYHRRHNKKPHWHIDYLLQRASISDIIVCQSDTREECRIARELSSQYDSIYGFGSSDCRCQSHLFFSTEGKQMKRAIEVALAPMSMPCTRKSI